MTPFSLSPKNPKLVDLIAELFDEPDIKLLGDQIFMKPPGHGSVKEYHQDSASWPFLIPQNQITCWIALDDATLENGCIRCLPGSQNYGLLQLKHLPQLLTEEMKANEVPVPIPARRLPPLPQPEPALFQPQHLDQTPPRLGSCTT